jgi:hypothetical protein
MTEELAASLSDQAIMIARAHLTANEADGAPSTDAAACRSDVGRSIDWPAIRDAITGAPSLERAVGRAVVLGARSARGETLGMAPGAMTLDLSLVDPFFSFSVADVVPDFGDHRPRTWLSQKFTRVFSWGGASHRRSVRASSTQTEHVGAQGKLRQPTLS